MTWGMRYTEWRYLPTSFSFWVSISFTTTLQTYHANHSGQEAMSIDLCTLWVTTLRVASHCGCLRPPNLSLGHPNLVMHRPCLSGMHHLLIGFFLFFSDQLFAVFWRFSQGPKGQKCVKRGHSERRWVPLLSLRVDWTTGDNDISQLYGLLGASYLSMAHSE